MSKKGDKEHTYLKISIITPVYNQVNYIEFAIQSVLGQNYPNLEYIIVDGGSSDGTLEIIKKYESQITKCISESDSGMYDALNKGFALSTGEIMGWINSDDVLCEGALQRINSIFNDVSHVSWIQGMHSLIDLNGQLTSIRKSKKFSLLQFLNNDYKWIQQESTFWRRSLWEKAGGKMDTSLKLAGDFELWFRFFQHERLYNCSVPVGAWRKREGQLSAMHNDKYLEEVEHTIKAYITSTEQKKKIKKINALNSYIAILKKFKVFNTNYLLSKRAKYYDIVDNEILYSQINQKFKTP